ncbi:MAG: hypothetical protein ACRECJ_04765, partial [Limisphaerales bacterium]
FRIYRDTLLGFSTSLLVGVTADSFFVDTVPPPKPFFYRVSAVDSFCHEGGLSLPAEARAGLKGDLNADSTLSPADVVLELNAVFLSDTFTAPFCAADLDCNGNLSPADVVLELNLVFLGTPVTCTP